MNDPRVVRLAGWAGAVLLAVWAALLVIFAPPAWAAWTTGLAGAACTGAWAAAERARLRRLVLSPALRTGGNAIGFTLTVVAVLALLNVITTRHSFRKDLTANRFYSLSDQTVKVIAALDKDIKFTAFVKTNSSEARQIEDLLDEYRHRGKRISVEMVDVDNKPAKTTLYRISAYNTLVIEAGGRRKDVLPQELFGYQFNGQQPQQEFKGETVITSALLSVASDRQSIVYFLEGHGELQLSDGQERGATELKAALERDNYVVKTLSLVKGGAKLPPDMDVLVLAGPVRGIPEGERKLLAPWLAGPGRMLVLVGQATAPGLEALLKPYGVSIVPGLVADPRSYFSFAGPLVPIPSYRPHRMTDDLRKQDVGVMMPFARGLKTTASPGAEQAPLLESTTESWSELDLKEGGATYDKGTDTKGPFTLGVAVSVTLPAATPSSTSAEPAPPAGPSPKLVVFGGSDWQGNAIRQTNSANADLFANAVAWLTGHDATVSIRPKARDDRRLLLDAVKVRLMWWLTVILTPLAVLAFGTVRWWRRRSL